jgi:rubrerythrin
MDKEMADNINSLIQLDIDAVSAYEQAIEKIKHPRISEKLSEFKFDHEHHIDRLSDVLRSRGQMPVERSPDFKGFFIEGFTSLRSMTGDEGALKAMRSNEELTNMKYKEAAGEWDLEPDIAGIVANNYEDEKRHLAYIEQALQKKSWEKSAVEY